MERRTRDARGKPLATAGGLTAAWVLVTVVSLLGASPDPGPQGAGAQPVGTPGTGTGRASDRPEIPLGLDLYLIPQVVNGVALISGALFLVVCVGLRVRLAKIFEEVV